MPEKKQPLPDEAAAHIGEVFQETTKYAPDKAMPGGPREPYPGACKTYADAPKTSLPAPEIEAGAGLWGLLQQRRSYRDFKNEEISADTLSQLLWASDGVTASRSGYDFRTAPSAGALYPVETYVFVHRVSGLEQGIYHYAVKKHELDLLREGDFRSQVAAAALGQKMAADAAVTFAWTSVVARCRGKYKQRAFRYMYLDAGHVGQNLSLAAEALDLGCCMIAALFDGEVNSLLGVDGEGETVIYMAAVGKKR